MKQHPYYRRYWALQRYTRGPLFPHLKPFADFLTQLGYPYATGQRFIREVGHLGEWAADQGISEKDISEETVQTYLRFRFRGVAGKVRKGPYNRLLEYLRKIGAVQPPMAQETALSHCLSIYQDHLTRNHGLGKDTICRHVRVARNFLSCRFVDDNIDFSELQSQDLVQYLLSRSQGCAPSSLGLEASRLRSFLRFLQFRGDVSARLVQSVPTVPRWRQKDVPVYLKPEEIRLLMKHCDQQTPKGRRDLAILSLLALLGLRAIEVCRLTLDDIDWAAGCITVRGKNGKSNRLPLLSGVGQAISTYLRHSRPRCSSRHLFVRSMASFEAFSSSSAVCHAVRCALDRASLKPIRKGSHLLRHSLATQMLQQGASLVDIGQILRHQRVDTTAIYAKVALSQLRPIARPWPRGGTS